MASFTAATTVKRKHAKKRQGRARKNAQARKSTLSTRDLFAHLGEVGKPVAKTA